MEILLSLLLWLHFLGLASGLGGGIALAQTGPRLVTSTEHERQLIWKFERAFSLTGSAGVGVLIVTGPLLVWLKYGGVEGMPAWFWAKMAFVLLTLVGVILHAISGRRFRTGDATAYRWMAIAGRTAGISMVLAVLCAVMTFD